MIGIISFLSPRYAQFIYKYTNILDKNNVKYEVIYWNRECIDYKFDSNWIGYCKSVNTFQPFYKKILKFFDFTFFMYKKIREKKYDKLIILTTQTAIPLLPLLITKYSNKYVYDYRDITYENIWIYKKLVKLLIKKSNYTAISSPGFKEVLGNKMEKKMIIAHNTRDFELANVKKIKSDKIRIVYWGMVRQLEFNYKICDILSKSNEISLTYHGAGYHKELEEYCKKNNYNNIKITGAYELKDIEEFAKNTDFILNSYENDKQQKPAMTVKYYDSLKYQIPMIVTDNSYMSKKVKENNLGISVNWDDISDTNEILRQIKLFDYKEYYHNSNKEISSINKDDDFFTKKLLDFIYGGENETE